MHFYLNFANTEYVKFNYLFICLLYKTLNYISSISPQKSLYICATIGQCAFGFATRGGRGEGEQERRERTHIKMNQTSFVPEETVNLRSVKQQEVQRKLASGEFLCLFTSHQAGILSWFPSAFLKINNSQCGESFDTVRDCSLYLTPTEQSVLSVGRHFLDHKRDPKYNDSPVVTFYPSQNNSFAQWLELRLIEPAKHEPRLWPAERGQMVARLAPIRQPLTPVRSVGVDGIFYRGLLSHSQEAKTPHWWPPDVWLMLESLIIFIFYGNFSAFLITPEE